MIGPEIDPVVTRFTIAFDEDGLVREVLTGFTLREDEEEADTEVLVSFDLRRDDELYVAAVDDIEYHSDAGDRDPTERRVPVHALAAVPIAEHMIRSVFDGIEIEPEFCEWIAECCDGFEYPEDVIGQPISADVGHTGGGG